MVYISKSIRRATLCGFARYRDQDEANDTCRVALTTLPYLMICLVLVCLLTIYQVQPNYPKIRREVLDKARAALRP